MKTIAPTSSTRPARRGSILIVAMVFSAIIGVSLVTFINLGQTNLRISHRAFYQNAALNLAESGLEQAIWSVNQMIAENPDAWDGWTTSGAHAYRDFTGFTYDANSTGNVRVYVQNHLGVIAPRLVARATITPFQGPPVEKWVKVDLTKRSLFANGLVAKDTITLNGGGATVDSYDSRLGAYTPSPSTANRFARGSAGSLSAAFGSFSLGNATIRGYVSIGTSDYSGLSVGPGGIVNDFGASGVDYNRVTTDFNADFKNAVVPTPTPVVLPAIDSTTVLPRAVDLLSPAADGKYYYSVPSISLTGSRNLTTLDNTNVVITVTANTGSAISVGGNGYIGVGSDGSLAIYARANVSIAGNGVANGNAPAAFQFWSTATTTGQTVSISGNGQLSGVVYAPNANVTLNGGGSSGAVYGAVVGNNITLNGGAEFHYDEALAALDNNNPYGIGSWEELTNAADRATWLARLTF